MVLCIPANKVSIRNTLNHSLWSVKQEQYIHVHVTVSFVQTPGPNFMALLTVSTEAGNSVLTASVLMGEQQF